jgi:PBP1b-binding outer membrane lipoprotein LpoB
MNKLSLAFAFALLLVGCASSNQKVSDADADAIEAVHEREARTGSNLNKKDHAGAGVKTIDPALIEQQRGGRPPSGVSGG